MTTVQTEPVSAVNIGLTEKERQEVARLLRAHLADEQLLYTKTRNYHWNVVGPHFTELHRLFESQYEGLARFADQTAERIRSLGGWSPGSLAEFLHEGHLDEQHGDPPPWRAMIENLLVDHESVIRTLRVNSERCLSQHRDAGTSDLMIGLMREHEKMAWMLRSLTAGLS